MAAKDEKKDHKDKEEATELINYKIIATQDPALLKRFLTVIRYGN